MVEGITGSLNTDPQPHLRKGLTTKLTGPPCNTERNHEKCASAAPVERLVRLKGEW